MSAPLKNARHEVFAQALAKGESQAEAYRIAYPKSKLWKDSTIHPHASKLASNDKVATRVAALQHAMAERSEVDGARVLQEAARIALADIREIFNDDGSLKSPKDWPDDVAAAVASVEVVEMAGGAEVGSEGIKHVPMYTKKIKMWDKNSALDKLFKNKGLFEQDNKQRRGDPIDDLTPQEQMALREYLKFVAAGPVSTERGGKSASGGKGRTTH